MKIVRKCAVLSWWLIGCAAAAFSIAALGGPVTISTFPSGALPEDIVHVPAGFGSAGGSFFVPDPSANFIAKGTIWSVPAGGGSPPPAFALGLTLQPIGGIFLPLNYGSLAGQFLAAGRVFGNQNTSDVVAFNAAGQQTAIGSGIGSSSFADVAIAPAGFDSAGGQIVLANEGGQVYTLGTDGSTFSPLLTSVPGNPFGLGFAPSGFGAVGGDLLITDSSSGAIYALSPSGILSPFTIVPLGLGQSGLRQIAFAPPGSPFAGDLFVSVSGSFAGGGIAGSIDVLNPAGQVIAFLAEGTVSAPYDPRGIYFLDATDFLFSDADASIIKASTSDLTSGSPAPEPATLALLGIGLAGLGLSRRRKLS